MMTNKKGNVKNYSKDKGYEIIPRSLLQHERLSLQAIGLLCNLQSYPEDWEIHKTEVYKRFPKNGKTSVANAWEELVEEKYIIQFRKRNGKKWEYIYYFNLEPFTDEQVKELEEKLNAKAMSFRFSEAQKSEVLSFRFSEPQNGNPKMGTSKPESNIIHIKENTHKHITQEQKTQKEIEEEDYINTPLEKMSYKVLKDFLKEKQIDKNDIQLIIEQLENNNIRDFTLLDIQKQYERTSRKTDLIDFVSYFVGGLIKIVKAKNYRQIYQEQEELRKLLAEKRDKSVYYDWLTETN